LPGAILGQELVAPRLSILTVVLMPLSFAYAILRYQVMDLQLYIRRGLVYSALAAIITVFYAAMLFAATFFAQQRSGVSNIIVIAILGAMVAVLGQRLRTVLQERIDRLFDRRTYDYRRQLLEFSRRMSGIPNPDELSESAAELIAQTMAPSLVRLYLYDPPSRGYRYWAGAGFDPGPEARFIGPHHPWLEGVRLEGEGVQRFEVPTESPALVLPLKNKGQQVGLLILGPKEAGLPYSSEDLSLLRTVANQLATATENAQLYSRMRDLYLSGIRTLAATVDAKDPYTHGHSERVAAYARAIAITLGLPTIDVETIELAGLLHDIGKIGIPDAVLQKPGRLDPEERAMIMEHAAIGAKILADNAALMSLVPLVRHHHEWYGGGGYPDGISGDQIPIGSAIISVADTFDTMTTDRPYRAAPGPLKAIAEIRRCAGTHFHPAVVQAFLGAFGARENEHPLHGNQSLVPTYTPVAGRITAVDTRAMNLVYRVVQMIGEVTELSSFLSRVSELLRREIGIGRFSIYLMDEDNQELVLQHHSAAEDFRPPLRIPIGHGAVGWAAEQSAPIRMTDALLDRRATEYRNERTRSQLAVPLGIEGRTIGVVNVESRRVGVFTEDDETLLTIVAQQLAQVVEVARLHDQLKRNALIDGLTGVANHRHFYERLEEEIARAQRDDGQLSVVLIDVDGLKLLNDTLGHIAGDSALRALASLIESQTRTGDVLARYGGDEFAIILPGVGSDDSMHYAARIEEVIEQSTFELNDRRYALPLVSWGTATLNLDGDRAVMLVSVADARMYRRKMGRRVTRSEVAVSGD
jgi:diguanylate cyclase (GGDEF)-like protein/putative nucleotidyltransferase with HDIG domain